VHSEKMEKHVIALNSSMTTEFTSLNEQIWFKDKQYNVITIRHLPENRICSRGSGSNEYDIRNKFSISALHSDRPR